MASHLISDNIQNLPFLNLSHLICKREVNDTDLPGFLWRWNENVRSMNTQWGFGPCSLNREQGDKARNTGQSHHKADVTQWRKSFIIIRANQRQKEQVGTEVQVRGCKVYLIKAIFHKLSPFDRENHLISNRRKHYSQLLFSEFEIWSNKQTHTKLSGYFMIQRRTDELSNKQSHSCACGWHPHPYSWASFLGWLLDFPLLALRCIFLPKYGATCMDRGPHGRQGTRNQCQHRPAALTRSDASITQLLDQQVGYPEARKSRVFCVRKSL